jgi:FkbM family methyltransferase
MQLNMAQRAGWLAHLYKAAFKQHHRELIPVLKPFIPEAGVVIDVGAHAGQFAKLFGRMAPKGRVFAFEPSPYALSILKPALGLNGLRNVTIVPEGLSDAPGAYELSTPIKKRGGMGFGIAHLGTDAEEGRAQVRHKVKVGTLDAFVEGRGLERLDFLKMDIEGWETPALRGGLGAIGKFRPAMLVEINEGHLARSGSKPADIWEMLTPLGYRARRLGEKDEAAAYVGPGDYVWTA